VSTLERRELRRLSAEELMALASLAPELRETVDHELDRRAANAAVGRALDRGDEADRTANVA